MKSEESVELFLSEKILEELTLLLGRNEGQYKGLIGQILALTSQNEEIAEVMRTIQAEIAIGNYLNQHRLRKSNNIPLDVEAKLSCIKALSNILSRPDEIKNKFNFVRARGLEALCVLALRHETRDTIKETIKCLANMAVNPKIQEEIDFNGTIDDLPKLINEKDGHTSLFQCARFLFLIIENPSFLQKLIKNKTFEWLGHIINKVREKRYIYIMFLLLLLRLNSIPKGAACVREIASLKGLTAELMTVRIVEEDLENPDFNSLVECIQRMSDQVKSSATNVSIFATLTPIVANILALLQVKVAQSNSRKTDQAKNKVLLKSVFKTLVNLSLSSECQKQFKTLNVVETLYPLCQGLINNIEQSQDSESFLACLRSLTNLYVIMPREYMIEDEKFTEMFLDMQNWNHFEDATINKEIRDEIKLILGISPIIESQSSNDDIATFFIKTLYSTNDFIVYKALCCLKVLIAQEKFREAIFRHKIHKILTNLMLKNEPYLSREAVSCLKQLLVGPSGLALWMKFSTNKFEIDHSLNNYILKYGNPQRLSEIKVQSIIEDWGIRVKRDDIFVIPDGLNLGEEYSISVWLNLSAKSRLATFHTLLQPEDGIGGMLVIDPEYEKIGAFDEETGDFVVLYNLEDARDTREWNNLICIVKSNDNPQFANKVDLFFNGQLVAKDIEINAPRRFDYVGNSKRGDEPFGVFSDLRIYNYALLERLIQKIYLRSDLSENPQDILDEADCCKRAVNILKTSNVEVQIELCGLIAGLNIEGKTRMLLIGEGILHALLPLVRSDSPDLKQAASKALVYLM